MPDPASLITAARLLTGQAPPGAEDACLRRAVSTGYYAVFHKLLRSAAARFMGPEAKGTAGYRLIYRSFDHGRMKDVCQRLSQSRLDRATTLALGRTMISKNMHEFASIFADLQDQRHAADYDPHATFLASDVADLIDLAEAAMGAFDRTEPAEQADVLALMMIRPRR